MGVRRRGSWTRIIGISGSVEVVLLESGSEGEREMLGTQEKRECLGSILVIEPALERNARNVYV